MPRPEPAPSEPAPPLPSLWKNRNFLLLAGSRMFGSTASQIQGVAVGWHVYDMVRDPMALGYVGLSLFLPMALLTLPGGDLADRFNRRRVLLAGQVLQALASGLILLLTLGGTEDVRFFYAALAIFGAGRAIGGPSQQAMLPLVVSGEQLGRAVAITSSAFQSSIIAGPALGGLVYMAGPLPTYGLCCLLLCLVVMATLSLRVAQPVRDRSGDPGAVGRLLEGIAYVRAHPILLGALSLDLFAVLLGGATALLPVYARDILHVGPQGLGLLRSAPAVGAVALGLLLGARPLGRHAGATMFAAVGLFGAATIVFGLSESFTLSLLCLLVMGAADMISVYVRQNLVQLTTPDAMRGRVNAVSLLFIGASNELGEFESGTTAAWFGTVPAVVIGGLGTIAVVGVWAWLFPSLRRVDRLEDLR